MRLEQGDEGLNRLGNGRCIFGKDSKAEENKR